MKHNKNFFSLKEINQNRQEARQQKEEANNKRIEELKQKVEKLENDTKGYVEDSIDQKHSQPFVKKGLKRVAKDLKFFKENSQCPTCHQNIHEVLRDAKTDVLVQGKALAEEIKVFDEAVKEYQVIIERQEGMNQMIRELLASETEREIVQFEFQNLAFKRLQ